MVQNIDQRAINTVRCLAADVVKGANSGHPGAPMGCAPIAHVLFNKFMTYNPKNPKFINRDRFVLSNGHACALQYIMLHIAGYDVSIEDLKQFRQLDSKTPGHPEVNDTPGIEVTTGPLGQGISNAVGLAAAEAHLAATFNKPGYEIFNNYTYCLLGDGCLQEGVSAEAISLAGHWKLGKLIALYDDNAITIDGSTEVSFTEDVLKRFESYGWHTIIVGDGDSDIASIQKAIEEAQSVTDKPTLIKVKTTIGYGSLNQGEEKVHGAPLSDDDIKQVKEKFGFSPEEKYVVPQEVYDVYAAHAAEGAKAEEAWNALFAKYKAEFPQEAAEVERRFSGKLPEGWEAALPRFTPADAPVATRKLSEGVLTALSDVLPELLGGSADLTGSNLTRWKKAVDFQHPSTNLGDYTGRYFRYGVREHGMFAIMNGLNAYGGNIPYGGTFLNFLTYGWGAARLSALSHFRVIYVMTHDSIGLGEDGPTHQPIETLVLTRATPNMLTFRPADGNEVSGTYLVALENQHRPSVIALSRQNLPQLQGSSVEAVRRGGYVLQDAENAKLILVATGSEVSLAVDAAKELAAQGIPTRVVSMPCTEIYDEQPEEYKKSVLSPGIPTISIEALGVTGWERYSHAQVGMRTFGASAPIKQLYNKFGITVEATIAKAKSVLAYYEKAGYVPEVGLEF
ncbi:transketolase [Gilbertella persicaria]|uniref:transketolase n=1 Tax=Gilbertella persicaria TaxID=101096 RepID=UPI002220F19F|nr:transketolase [Gilbertella persicaria]KAI8075818.1 transketolase [Gilbertella persicaria]